MCPPAPLEIFCGLDPPAVYRVDVDMVVGDRYTGEYHKNSTTSIMG